MSTVYILRSTKDKKLYIGSTRDTAEKRLGDHNAGRVRSTKGRRPFILLHKEPFDDYAEARRRESYLKTGQGRRSIENLIQ
jgi:putative endonuclease